MCIIGGQGQSEVNPRDRERKGTQDTDIAFPCLVGPLRKTLIEESNTRLDENYSKVTDKTGKKLETFADIGISADTLSMLCESNVPSDGIFKAPLPKDVSVKLPDDWQKHLGKDKLVRNWCELLVGIIKQHNQYCTLVFKGNHVSSLESRKRNCALVRGHAVCAHRPICTAEVHFSVTKSDLNTMHLKFKGEITHNVRNPRARHISGLAREQKRQIFEKKPTMPPSDVYRNDLSALSADAFAAGDRTGAGKSKRVIQEIKNETKKRHRDTHMLHETLSNLQKDLLKSDENAALRLKQLSRRLFGYIHSVELVPSLRIVLLHEPLLRLYHGLAARDILYFDATGGVVEKLRQYKRILYYAFCVRHPYGKTPPLPVAEFVSSSHTKDSISRSISMFREKEKLIFNGQSV